MNKFVIAPDDLHAARLLKAAEVFRDQLARLDNPPEDERAVRIVGLSLGLIRAAVPDLVGTGKLDAHLRYLSKLLDATSPDVHGGADSKLPDEVRILHLGAIADVLHSALGMPVRQTRKRVTGWTGVPDSTIRKWASKGVRLKIHGHEDQPKAAAPLGEK